jgi:integrase
MAAYTKNKSGYYRASIVTGYTADGKQKRETIRSKSLTEFKEKLKAAENLHEQGYDFDAKNITVGEWADKWLETYKKPHVRQGTYNSYEIDIRVHIKPALGHYKIIDVKPFNLQEFLNGFKGESTSHVQKLHLCISQIFKRAYIEGIIVKDVSMGLILPDSVAGERRPFTAAEQTAIKKVAETHRAGLWVLTMLYAGLRPEETISLMWSDIDFTKGNESITVRRAAEWISNKAEIKKPKKKEKKQGKEAERTIPISAELAERLRIEKHRGLYVFPPAESDGMMSRTNKIRMWDSFHRAVDIEMGAELYRNKIVTHVFDATITPYYLRHTCCTNWFEMGLDLKTVQYLMGHADIKTTANIYTHFMERSLDKAGDIIRGNFNTRGQTGDKIETII